MPGLISKNSGVRLSNMPSCQPLLSAAIEGKSPMEVRFRKLVVGYDVLRALVVLLTIVSHRGAAS